MSQRRQRVQDSVERQLPPRKTGHCRWCGVGVKAPRRTWCSDACVEQYSLLTDPARFRPYVFERARGRCQLCNIDLARRQRLIESWTRRLAPMLWAVGAAPLARLRTIYVPVRQRISGTGLSFEDTHVYVYEPATRRDQRQEQARRLIRVLAKFRVKVGSPCWEVDHVEPLADGGSHSLANLRLLCCACHRGVTAAQAGARRGRLKS